MDVGRNRRDGSGGRERERAGTGKDDEVRGEERDDKMVSIQVVISLWLIGISVVVEIKITNICIFSRSCPQVREWLEENPRKKDLNRYDLML